LLRFDFFRRPITVCSARESQSERVCGRCACGDPDVRPALPPPRPSFFWETGL
jgi:hypothetical protein